MWSKFLLPAVLFLALLTLNTTKAQAEDDAVILGTWESFNADAHEFTFVTFGEEGMLAVEVYDAEQGRYKVDADQHRLAWTGMDSSAEEELEWADYQLDGDKLMINDGDMELPFTCIRRPEEPANELAGRWKMLIEEVEGIDELRESGEEVPESFMVDMGNNGIGTTMELSKSLTGTYALDVEAGTFEATVGDETESGTYRIDGPRLVLTVDDEELVYERSL
jgi:hypothetical protein